MQTILLLDPGSAYFELKQALERAGFRTTYAINELEGLEALLYSSYDLIILAARQDDKEIGFLNEFLETCAEGAILIRISKTHELGVSRLPQGPLPSYFNRFFIEAIQFLHNRQQKFKHQSLAGGHHVVTN